jgi:hypothetical protein
MQVVDNIVHKLSTGRTVGDLRMSKLKKELRNSDTDSFSHQRQGMTPEEARKILDQVKDGKNIPVWLITIALIFTGDIDGL